MDEVCKVIDVVTYATTTRSKDLTGTRLEKFGARGPYQRLWCRYETREERDRREERDLSIGFDRGFTKDGKATARIQRSAVNESLER